MVKTTTSCGRKCLKRPLPAASTTTTGVDSANNTSKRQRRNNYLKEVVGNTTFRQGQAEAFNDIMELRDGIFKAGPGEGKSIVVVAAIAVHYHLGENFGAVILAPYDILKQQWRENFADAGKSWFGANICTYTTNGNVYNFKNTYNIYIILPQRVSLEEYQNTYHKY